MAIQQYDSGTGSLSPLSAGSNLVDSSTIKVTNGKRDHLYLIAFIIGEDMNSNPTAINAVTWRPGILSVEFTQIAVSGSLQIWSCIDPSFFDATVQVDCSPPGVDPANVMFYVAALEGVAKGETTQETTQTGSGSASSFTDTIASFPNQMVMAAVKEKGSAKIGELGALYELFEGTAGDGIVSPEISMAVGRIMGTKAGTRDYGFTFDGGASNYEYATANVHEGPFFYAATPSHVKVPTKVTVPSHVAVPSDIAMPE
jgi:hypothetical protein